MAILSHAIVLPDQNFEAWLTAVQPYLQTFERTAVIRSPAGNDLNRFRNITAVQAPLTWVDDDALNHIRRAYPSVVRIDVIQAAQPDQLRVFLQVRVNNRDRYGELTNQPPHIFDRFVLDWFTEARPCRITRAFSTAGDPNPDLHEGIDVTAPTGTLIRAAAPGQVTRVQAANDALNYGPYVQTTTTHDGQTCILTYGGLRDIRVTLNQPIKTGDPIGVAAGPVVKLVAQNPPGGVSGMKLPNVIDPVPLIYWEGLRLRSTAATLRVRALPNANAPILGNLTPNDVIETRESHGRTLVKLGNEGQWLRISRAGVREAYTAAWFLDAYSLNDPAEALPGIALPGMNLDMDHPQGRPDPAALRGLGWVRMLYNVSLNPNFPQGDPRRHGNTDLDFTYNRYRPLLDRYIGAGLKVILVLTHQTYGEGQGFVWHQMNADRWRELTTRYADFARRIAAQYAGRGLIYAYQIWNEQDTAPEHARAAVPMPAAEYAKLLTATIRAIRSVDTNSKIITGGHVSGGENGSAYARATLGAMPGDVRPDGIAFHPYGNGPAGSPFTIHGPLDGVIRRFADVMPGRPVWITEWGVLDRQGDDSIAGQVSQYASGFMNIIRTQFPGKVAAACWYAWADGMDNGYGLVKSNGTPRQPLYDSYRRG
jgi:hypothetical protein